MPTDLMASREATGVPTNSMATVGVPIEMVLAVAMLQKAPTTIHRQRQTRILVALQGF